MKNTNKPGQADAKANGTHVTKQTLTVDDQDEVYNTVTSYPPMSLSNSLTSLQSIGQNESVDAVPKFIVEKVITEQPQPPRPFLHLTIPQISIDSEPPLTPQDEIFRNTDYSNESTITSLTNGIVPQLSPRPRHSASQSPPLDRKIPPLQSDHFNKIRRSFVEESTESGTESEAENFMPNKSVIEDIIAQPIIRNARKEGVISDKIDQKDVSVVNYRKSDA